MSKNSTSKTNHSNTFLFQSFYPDFDSCIHSYEDVKKKPTICNFPLSTNLQFTYFCGSAPICKDGGNFDTIQRAKFNAEVYYSVVGMSHDLKRSFELLEAFLPAFFSNAKSEFHEGIRLHKNAYPPIKNETLDALMKIPAIQMELDFYSFLLQRFELQYEKFITL